MKSTTTKHLYCELVNKYGLYGAILYSSDGEEPTYESDSLLVNHGVTETDDINVIFEDAVNVFKIKDKDKPHLWKLLTDFSIEEFLNNEQDPDFLYFLQYYDFYIKVCVNKQYL